MYDFELAFMVAVHSQTLDPGECQLELRTLSQPPTEPLRRCGSRAACTCSQSSLILPVWGHHQNAINAAATKGGGLQ